MNTTPLSPLQQHRHYSFLISVITALFAVFVILVSTPDSLSWRETFYLWTLPFYYTTAIVLLALLLSPLALIPGLRYLLPALGTVWLTYLIADLIVFHQYQFHINPLLIEMFVADFKGMGFSLAMQIAGFTALTGLLLMNLFVWHKPLLKPKAKTGSILLAVSLVLFLFGQTLHVWAQHFGQSSLTRHTSFLPLYYPTTSSSTAPKLAENFPALFPALEAEAGLQAANMKGSIHYPKQLSCQPKETKNHTLMIVLESWRADALAAQVMPSTFALAQQAQRFQSHIAGGNATIPGLFSLLYGLHPSYYEAFRINPLQNRTLLTQTFIDQGYQTHFWSSTDFTRFDLERLFFSAMPTENHHYFLNKNTVENDRELVERFTEALASRSKAQSYFDFVFLSSSHFSYHYPKSMQAFLPVSGNKSEHLVNKFIDGAPLKNDQRNSFYYLDTLLNQIYQTLQDQGLWEQTQIILTGDHAEAFNDYQQGFWGHGSHFAASQTHVPLIVKPAGRFETKTIENPTAHQDIAPTLLLETLGCDAQQVQDATNGIPLTHTTPERDLVLSSYFTSAYWINGRIYEALKPGQGYQWQTFEPIESRPKEDLKRIQNTLLEETKLFRSNTP